MAAGSRMLLLQTGQSFRCVVSANTACRVAAQKQSDFGIRHYLLALGLAVLAGCAHTPVAKDPAPETSKPPAAQAAVPTPQPAPQRTRRAVKETSEPHEPERLAAVDPKSLIGLAPNAVEHLLGTPTAISNSTPSLVWTYSGQGCSFKIVFYPDIKTESFHALKVSSGGSEDSNCIRNILTVKSNGPS